ncbi:TetR/AcrR family transcriptional regulator [Leisingera sp. JC1]|uniref:TetR/AcrR family transcriptional regulator n=1 Tax=Leisingera sp. JC1 TaxID=1855282 RepID=UPI0008038840|nr:helix-turn-helix domain-containing protein [Leisingera sp. JC1]OBY25021.1 hypothetical protein A9D60_07280 [Leisingera sp. JC1]
MGRHKEFDPDDAVEAALKVFWRKGYHDASLQDLIAGTGVKNYGLYSVFGSKHGLYLAAFDRYNRDVPPSGPENDRPDGPKPGHALTIKLDHSSGADQWAWISHLNASNAAGTNANGPAGTEHNISFIM